MTEQGAAEERFRVQFREALAAARDARLDQQGLRPRGIIIPAGGALMFTCAYVAARMLRHHLKTNLPIEVWHLGPGEMSPAMAALLREIDVETVDALALAGSDGGGLGGFELKSFALLHCRFREVLMLDADNVPLIDPLQLFEDERFRGTGALFWPDFVSLKPSSGIWDLCGVSYRHMPSFESGQMMIDRARHLPALVLSWFLNRNSNVTYQHVYGDKDSFLIAWLALEAPYHLVAHPAKRLQGTICQFHPDGRRMFQHRNQQKWKLIGGNIHVEGFVEEATCLSYIADLMAAWHGRVFTPPSPDEGLRALERDLAAQRVFRIETVSIGAVLVELRPGNLMLRDGGPAQCWWLSREHGVPLLHIGEDEIWNRRFVPYGADYWRSAARAPDEQDLILTPAADPDSLRPRGHNSASAMTSLKGWFRNYEFLDGQKDSVR